MVDFLLQKVLHAQPQAMKLITSRQEALGTSVSCGGFQDDVLLLIVLKIVQPLCLDRAFQWGIELGIGQNIRVHPELQSWFLRQAGLNKCFIYLIMA